LFSFIFCNYCRNYDKKTNKKKQTKQKPKKQKAKKQTKENPISKPIILSLDANNTKLNKQIITRCIK